MGKCPFCAVEVTGGERAERAHIKAVHPEIAHRFIKGGGGHA